MTVTVLKPYRPNSTWSTGCRGPGARGSARWSQRLTQRLLLLDDLLVGVLGVLVEARPELLELGVVRARLVELVVVEERDGVVELEEVVLLHVDGLLVRGARVLEVVEPVERDGEVHVRRGEVGLEVDARREVVECAGVLPRVEVHQPEVVRDDPLEGVEVQRALEARDARDVALLAW